MNALRETRLRYRIKWLTCLFIIGLVASGATAIPLVPEAGLLGQICERYTPASNLTAWLVRVRDALVQVQAKQPFLFYGTDWLAFGHFVIALVFLGPLRDPIRNRWIYDFGLLACALLIPYAFIFGAVREIPMWWRLVDCSFGVFGALPLWLCRRWVQELEVARGNG